MGCNVSRLDSHGHTFPAKLRPLLLQRFEGIKACRHHHAGHPLKDRTPSKKELLSPDNIDIKNMEDEIHASRYLPHPPDTSETNVVYSPMDRATKHHNEPPKNDCNNDCYDVIKENVVEDGVCETEMREGSRTMEKDDDCVKAMAEDIFEDANVQNDDDDDNDDIRERRIGCREDGEFPGSPSFQVFFKDNEAGDGHGKNGVSVKNPVSSQDSKPSKEFSVEKKKAKKEKKRRSFRNVLPKNLLGMKSCYTSSHSHTSSLDNSRFLAAKATT